MGAFGMSSFIGYNTNWIVCITLMALIFIGGIGFFVWGDLKEHKLHIRKYALHTKIVLITSLILIIGPSILFLILERHALFADMNTPQAILKHYFVQSHHEPQVLTLRILPVSVRAASSLPSY